MKKTFTTSIFVAVLAFIAATANAKSWRVNSNTTQKADFVSLNAVISSSDVKDGDTIYLDPGCLLTDNQTLGANKTLTIVGPGYLRSGAPHQAATITGTLYIDNPNTKIEGVVVMGDINIRAQNVTIERCKTQTIKRYNADYQAQYATIRQCYVQGSIYGYGNSATQTSNWTIENNIIIYNGTTISNLLSPVIRNNYIKCSHTLSGYYAIYSVNYATIQNNILLHTKHPNSLLNGVSDAIFTNNVMSCTSTTYAGYAADNTFIASDDESLIFALEGTNDQQYRLKEDSPAKGVADDGGDCGPFGGQRPYVVSGLPAGYPYYTKAVVGTKVEDGKVKVSLNIKMQDE